MSIPMEIQHKIGRTDKQVGSCTHLDLIQQYIIRWSFFSQIICRYTIIIVYY